MSEMNAKERQATGNKLTPNQKLLLRLQQHPNRVVRLLLVLDGKGQVQIANVEDVGKVERFG
jgi:hypothetical protein